MRKLYAILSVLALVVVVNCTAKAANQSMANVFPGLNFSGTKATCSLSVYAEHTTDLIEATVTLKQGSTTVKQWTNLSANGIMIFSDTANVSHGQSYTLQVTLSINGASYPVSSVTKTCP